MNKKIIIVGAGPGGLQLAYYLEKNNMDYIVLEKNEKSGSFFAKYPVHRKMISINKVHTGIEDPETNMRFDWNSLLTDDYSLLLKKYTKEYFPSSDDVVEYMNEYSEVNNLKIVYDAPVHTIRKDELFEVETPKGTFTCEYLVMATGVSKPYIPNVPNIHYARNYTELTQDFTAYANKRVLVLGKGNSAFETADSLIPYASLIHCISPTPLKLAWETHFVGNLRAINNNFLDTYQLKSQNGVINGEIAEIQKEGDQYRVTVAYGNANGEVEELMYDEIIVCTGFRFDTDIFEESARPSLVIKDKFPAQKSNWESKNIENLFFAGTITQVRDYKKSTSSFIHGFRYNSKCLYHILDTKINNAKWVSESVEERTIEAITDKVIKNINRAASIWQQFGFIGHVLAYDDDYNFTYYYDVPVDYLHENREQFGSKYFVITLEYGNEAFMKAKSVFNVERVHKDDYRNADKSAFLHPILRQYEHGEHVSTHHIIEDFESNWNEEVHIKPLTEYFETQLILQKV
jgi:thioredoxin reductase